MAELYRRHDLLDVDPGAWAAMLAQRPDLDGVPHVADWARHRRPVIVRRRHPDEEPGSVPVGLPLPPADGKRRIGFALPPGAVRPRPPVTLSQVIRGCPTAWSPTLAGVVELGRRHGLVPRLFGGLLWQSLTGLTYLSETSDLDLLWPVGALPRDLLAGLAAIEARAPMRLDGEILLPDGGGVNWRELHAAAPEDTVLVKHLDRLALRKASSLLAGHPE
ncbi:malonate decarboxylase holo-[acyl-carrier-protein] synthase [Methylobacterium nodulans]|uniref:Holo-ACP synthase, malonate decarboxylase-specific n=1 Tax=Methylobacterium nodulans (strain LMG 21967 / CNCM I-2342 / ORS 2060) TaxID=460265 RepID=B8IJN7_METNO|nr:malonate decarboxylase holo-[acyl-carrier-protein] synthase [Methylobacterium nodulans]ACL58085.1 holo-ACP synthase, malonate decarboxylase-specific [Methylobacterium nodulans ORS 2060]